jgi:hypothetical protein
MLNWNLQTTWERYYKLWVPPDEEKPAGPDNEGKSVTYGRVAWRFYRGPNPWWGYMLNTQRGQFPDHPLNEYRHRVERLLANFPITPTSRILVLGCGIGLLPETLIWWKQQSGRTLAQAQAEVAGLDNSSWIQGNLTAEAHSSMFTGTTPKVGNRDYRLGASNAQVRGTLRQIWGGSEFGDFVIVESVDESYTDAERTAAYWTAQESYLAAGRPRANLIHIITDEWDARGYWVYNDITLPDGTIERQWSWVTWPAGSGGSQPRTLEQWAALRPTNSWMSYIGDMRVIPGTG